jgi:type I restriction enzyme S subunit
MSEHGSWSERRIERSAYLRGRIGWQGLRADEFVDDGPYLVTGTDFQNGAVDWSRCYHVSEARFREAAQIQLRDGDLLVTKDGTIGKIAQVADCPDQAVLNSGVFLLRCSDGSFRHRFLYHLLRSHHFDTFLRQNLAGSTINHLYQYVFERFSFLVPTDDEQERICRILDLLDIHIEATEASIAKQERVRQGLIQELFTRGIGADGGLRPAREEAPQLYVQIDIGWLPKGWKAVKLQQISDVQRGRFGARPRNDPQFYGGAFPFIQTSDIAVSNGRILSSHSQSLNGRGLLTSKLFPKGAIAISIAANIGDAAILAYPMCAPDSVVGITPFRMDDNKFIQIAIGLKKEWLERRAPQTAQKNINLADLRPLKLPFPPRAERERIVEIASAMMDDIVSLEVQLAKVRMQKAGLMQDLLTGRVSVEPLLAKAAA